ncbi:MAG TPA: hypothetical protein VGH02_06910 [Rhizomicrobium sp.]|jgi:hypothetical protein
MGVEKVMIQVGTVSVSAETEGDVLELLRSALTFAREELMQEKQKPASKPVTIDVAGDAEPHSAALLREGTVNSVAAIFGGGSGREVLYSAAVYLTFFVGKPKWTRSEWMEAAKQARDWKALYSNGAARDIGRMVKAGEINENATDVFSLSTASLAEAEPRLG